MSQVKAVYLVMWGTPPSDRISHMMEKPYLTQSAAKQDTARFPERKYRVVKFTRSSK